MDGAHRRGMARVTRAHGGESIVNLQSNGNSKQQQKQQQRNKYAIRTAEQRSSRAELRAQRAAPRADCRGSSGDNRASHPKDDKWIWDFDFSADQHSDGRHIGGLSVQR